MAGVEDKRKATTETQYRLASVSKIITVSALAKLAGEGKINLDTPVSEIIPDFPGVEGVTVRQLAGHLGGIAHYQMQDKFLDKHHYISMEQSLDVFKASPRSGPAGEQYVYSTHGFTLLSAIVETMAEKPFLEYLETEIFEPLGMDRAGPDDRTDISPDMSTLYRLTDEGLVRIQEPEDPSYKWGGGGMIGTPSDLVRLANGYVSGFFDENIVRDMWTIQKTNAGEETGVGVGWRIGEDFNGRNIRHHAGSMGGARSVLVLYPDRETAIATTTNSTWVSVVELNATMILEAFNHLEKQDLIPSGEFNYSGKTWDGETQGIIAISGNRGRISTPDPLKNWFRSRSVDQMPVFYLRDDLWAIVTPYGIAPFTLTKKDKILSGKMFIRNDRLWEISVEIN